LHRRRDSQRLGLGVPALGEVPDALLAATTDDCDLAACAETLEHQPHLPLAPPAVLLAPVARRVLHLAGEERATLSELSEDVAAVGGVLLEPVDDVPVCSPVAAAHEGLEDRQVLDRIEVRVPLHELALLPEQPVDLLGLERAEPAPEDEVLRRGYARDRVELEEAEASHGLEDAVRAAVERLRADRDAPRFLDRHLTHDGPPPAR